MRALWQAGPGLAALLTAGLLLAGCGSEPSADGGTVSDTAAAEGGDDVPEGGDTEGDGVTSAVVVLDGVTYQFEGDESTCIEVSGGLIAGLPLTQIDGNPAPDGAGTYDMSLYPEGLEDQSQISVKLPDGRFGAGYNELGMTWPEITLDRDGLNAIGEQPLSTHTGEESVAMIRVECG